MVIPRAVALVIRDHKVLVFKRYYRASGSCALCTFDEIAGPCPGHHYLVLPGGGVEEGESAAEAAVRELWEETTMRARVDRLLFTGSHNGRPASYFLMTDVSGRPEISGQEIEDSSPANVFTLMWAAPADLAALVLRPAEILDPLSALLRARPTSPAS